MKICSDKKSMVQILLGAAFLIFSSGLYSEGLSENWAGIAGSKINIREKPKKDSKVLLQVNPSDSVKVLKKTEEKILIDGREGSWVYGEFTKCTGGNGNCRTVKGWIFDYFLAYKNRLVKVTDWSYASFSESAGDIGWEYKFSKDGKYSSEESRGESMQADLKEDCRKNSGKYRPGKDSFFGTCIVSGHLYRYLNLISLDRKDHFLYINEKGKLCSVQQEESCR
ncbi:MAG TPA: SH3 domain-containing protein [Leptospiraceae bacterium]|nr:SH3 domain-containing protein [Leptospiraceae bacterium]